MIPAPSPPSPTHSASAEEEAAAGTTTTVDYFWVGFVGEEGNNLTDKDVPTGPHLFRVTENEVHCVIVDDLINPPPIRSPPELAENAQFIHHAHVSLAELGLENEDEFYAWYPFGFWQLLQADFVIDGDIKLKKVVGAVAGRCLRIDQAIENPSTTISEIWRLYQLPYVTTNTTPVLVYCMSLRDFKQFKTDISAYTDDRSQTINRRPTATELGEYGRSFTWIRLKQWVQAYFCYEQPFSETPTPVWVPYSQDFFGIRFQAIHFTALRLLLETFLMVRYNDLRYLSGTGPTAVGEHALLRWNDTANSDWIRVDKEYPYPNDADVDMALDAIMDDGAGVLRSSGTVECLTVDPSHGSFNDDLTPLKVRRADGKFSIQIYKHRSFLLGFFPPEVRWTTKVTGEGLLTIYKKIFDGLTRQQHASARTYFTLYPPEVPAA